MSTRILVVDDHAVALRAICNLLERSGEVDIVGTAGTGKEALSAIRQLQPDLVLLDLMMPDIDGFGILTTMHTEGQPPKVVVLTMYDTPAAKRKALAGGATAFVSKMRAHRDLMSVIREAVEA